MSRGPASAYPGPWARCGRCCAQRRLVRENRPRAAPRLLDVPESLELGAKRRVTPFRLEKRVSVETDPDAVARAPVEGLPRVLSSIIRTGEPREIELLFVAVAAIAYLAYRALEPRASSSSTISMSSGRTRRTTSPT